MSNFNPRDPNSDKQVNENNQAEIKISPAKSQKLNGNLKIYHWANLIIIPIILVVVLKPDRFSMYGTYLISIGFVYLVISSLINDLTRGWLFKFYHIVNEIKWGLGCVFSWIGQLFLILVILAVVIGAAGTLILIPVLWLASLKAIIQDIASQMGDS